MFPNGTVDQKGGFITYTLDARALVLCCIGYVPCSIVRLIDNAISNSSIGVRDRFTLTRPVSIPFRSTGPRHSIPHCRSPQHGSCRLRWLRRPTRTCRRTHRVFLQHLAGLLAACRKWLRCLEKLQPKREPSKRREYEISPSLTWWTSSKEQQEML